MPLKALIRKLRPARSPAGRKRTLPVDAELTAWCASQALRMDLPDLAKAVRVSWNPRMVTTAGRAFWPLRAIELNPRLRGFASEEMWNTLKHELAHLVAYERNRRRKIAPHGTEWRLACAELGIAGETVFHELPFPRRKRQPKHAYQCPHCRVVLERVKAIRRAVACYDCCRRHNKSRYDPRFRLVKVALKAPG